MMRNGGGGAPPRPGAPAPGPAGGAPAAGGACCASKRPALAIERRTAAATNEAILRMPFFSFSSVIDVSGAGVDGRLIVLLAVDAFGGAIFLRRAGGEHFPVAIECDRDAEFRGGFGVGNLDGGRGDPRRGSGGVKANPAGGLP